MPLRFTPAAAPIDSSQSRDLANGRPGSESFDAGNFTENLETHELIVPGSFRRVNNEQVSTLRGEAPSARHDLPLPPHAVDLFSVID